MVEVAGHERDIEIPGLADRLAVVERLQHGEQAGVLLHVAGERVEVAGAGVPAHLPPTRLGGTSCRDCRIESLVYR